MGRYSQQNCIQLPGVDSAIIYALLLLIQYVYPWAGLLVLVFIYCTTVEYLGDMGLY